MGDFNYERLECLSRENLEKLSMVTIHHIACATNYVEDEILKFDPWTSFINIHCLLQLYCSVSTVRSTPYIWTNGLAYSWQDYILLTDVFALIGCLSFVAVLKFYLKSSNKEREELKGNVIVNNLGTKIRWNECNVNKFNMLVHKDCRKDLMNKNLEIEVYEKAIRVGNPILKPYKKILFKLQSPKM